MLRSFSCHAYSTVFALFIDSRTRPSGISKMTLYKYLRLRGVEIGAYGGRTVYNNAKIDLTGPEVDLF